jgi:hypothetical protein
MAKRVTKTDRIELVETQNIALSLQRMSPNGYDNQRWRRAFYHALTMTNIVMRREVLVKIREALDLP